ncbi:MAG: hypothetical protein K2W96_15740 [Gemmataceae bacterium]|nr:hypothetical protein [Gemmataceae bacterium]
MWLLHGTTLHRAERIIQAGPDLRFVEPGGAGQPAENITFVVEGHPACLGSAARYAADKSGNFPNEGGPAIVAVDLPDELAMSAARELAEGFFGPLDEADLLDAVIGTWGGIMFEQGPAFAALLSAWPGLPKELRRMP